MIKKIRKKLGSLRKKRNEIVRDESYHQRVQCMMAFIAIDFEENVRSTCNVSPEGALCFYKSLYGNRIKKYFNILNGFLKFKQNVALKFRLFEDNGKYYCQTSFVLNDSEEWATLDLDNCSGGNNGYFVIFEVNDMIGRFFMDERVLNYAISQQKEDHELQP